MPRGDKSSYTDKQKRQAQHIEESYQERGVPDDEAEARAWATVNKVSGGGQKSGSGRIKVTNKESIKKGGAASASRPAAQRSASANKSAATRAKKKKSST